MLQHTVLVCMCVLLVCVCVERYYCGVGGSLFYCGQILATIIHVPHVHSYGKHAMPFPFSLPAYLVRTPLHPQDSLLQHALRPCSGHCWLFGTDRSFRSCVPRLHPPRRKVSSGADRRPPPPRPPGAPVRDLVRDLARLPRCQHDERRQQQQRGISRGK